MRLTLAMLVVALAISTTGGATMAITKGSGGGIKGPKPPSWYTGATTTQKQKGGGISGTAGVKATQPQAQPFSFSPGGVLVQTPGSVDKSVQNYQNAQAIQREMNLGGVGYMPGWADSSYRQLGYRNPVRNTSLANPTALSSNSFIGGGGTVVRGANNRPVNLAQYSQQVQNMSDAIDRRNSIFEAYAPGGVADADVGNIELGNWIGDYIRSLRTVPPTTNDTGSGGGVDWWGRRRGGGGGGYAGYNPYVPAWATGLFQLNANR